MTTRALLRDVGATTVRHLVTIAGALVTMPVLARTLGSARLGFWGLLGTSAFLLALCDLGLGAATLRVAAGHDAAGAKRGARLAGLVTAVLAVPVAAGCGAWLHGVALRLPAEHQADARRAVTIALVAGIVHAIASAMRSYAHGQGRLVALAHARAVSALAQLVVTLALVWMSPSLTAVAVGYAASVAAEGLLSVRAAADDVWAKGLPTRDERRALFAIGRSALVTNVSVALCVRADVIILERVTTLEVVGVYSVAARLVDQGFTLVKQLSSALVPRLGTRSADRASVIHRGTMALGALAGAPLGAVAAAGAPLVVLWAGPAVDHPVLQVALTWLAIANVFAAIGEIPAAAISLAYDPAVVARASVASTAMNVALSIVGGWLVGAGAVAAATAIGNAVLAVMVWAATCSALGWSPRRALDALAPAAIATTVAAATSLAAQRLGAHPIAVVCAGACAGLAAAALRVRGVARGTEAATP